MTAVTLSDRLKKANWLLLGLALLLTGIGVSTFSTAAVGRATDWAGQQFRWAAVAVAATLLVLTVPYRRIVAGFLPPSPHASTNAATVAGVAGTVVAPSSRQKAS